MSLPSTLKEVLSGLTVTRRGDIFHTFFKAAEMTEKTTFEELIQDAREGNRDALDNLLARY